MTAQSSSLRDYYVEPSATWTFSPPASPPSPANATSVTIPASRSYQWANRPAHNSIFDLSPSLDLRQPSGVNVALLFKTVVASAVLQYSSTAIAMPWEVGKLLLQVQWVPRNAVEPEPLSAVDDENDDTLSDTSNDDSYFADPNSAAALKNIAPRLSDDQGYILRRSVMEDGTRPDYIIPVGSADGVWGMMNRVRRFRGEGWLSLWKGLLTSCVTEIISSTMQPIIHGFLQSLFFPNLSPFHQPPIILPVASHLITGFILSPLDLIRTRLIVQSRSLRHRSYSGPIDALSQILRDEGGLKGIYLHPHLLIPTLIDNALRPIVSLALPSMLAARMGQNLTEDSNPVAWSLAELGGNCVGLLVTLPFETVRRRLQIQTRGTAKRIRTCVETRPAPYNGVVDAYWSILTEERSDLPLRPSKRPEDKEGTKQEVNGEYGESESWLKSTGVGQLYRGLSMRLGAGALVFFLTLISGGEESDGGWAEI